MTHGVRNELRVPRTGLIAGPLHDAARAAVREWHCTATRPP